MTNLSDLFGRRTQARYPPSKDLYFSRANKAAHVARVFGGGKPPLYHEPHKPGGRPHYHVHGHKLVNGHNMHFYFRHY